MQITFIKSGLLTTVQDVGRMHYLAQAIPVSGVMDPLAARIANKAVGNADEDAVIEFSYGGASFMTETDVLIAFSGDGSRIMAGNTELPADRPLYIPAGVTVKLVNNDSGSHSFLAIAGGWNIPVTLGSRSTYLPASLGGLEGRALKPGDTLINAAILSYVSIAIIKELIGDAINYTGWGIGRRLLLPKDRRTLRVIAGNEYDWFTKDSAASFFSQTWTLSNSSNRIGYYLEGTPVVKMDAQELLSTAVTPGTIQVTGSGGPILLMADCQTTGGYPRIAQVVAADLPLCGQLKPGDAIRFKKIMIHEAERLYFEQENQLQEISEAIRLRYS